MRRLSPSSQEGSPSLTLTGPDCGLAEITNGFSRGGSLNISPPDSLDLIRYLLQQPFIVEMGSPDLVTSPPASTKPGRQRSLNDSTANHASNWSCHDDNLLVTARARGQGWSQIQKEHFQTKTANACRKRHERLVAKRRSTEWNQEMLEKLSAEYIRRREQMWQPLANAVGEKWQNVEKACFEKGLKSLITQSRSQRKRDDDILHQQIQPGNISKHKSDEYPRRTSVMHLKDILAPD